MPTLELKPTHKPVANYYDNLARFEKLGIKHEGAVRSAFHELLETCARQFDWKLVPEYRIKRKGQADVSADGAVLTCVGNIPTLVRGLWEAKDSADDLKQRKLSTSSSSATRNRTSFSGNLTAPALSERRAPFRSGLTKPDDLVHILKLFLDFAPPAIVEWDKAVEEFKDRIPQIGASLKKLIETERQEHFHGAVENAAATITDFHEKQTFLNTVYERFFQGFCVKVADTTASSIRRNHS